MVTIKSGFYLEGAKKNGYFMGHQVCSPQFVLNVKSDNVVKYIA